MSGSPNIPFLPPEIFLVLAQHIHRDDLPNYRRANRTLAEAGQPELFHTIILRNTCASVSGFNHIRQNKQLSKLVRTVIWDTHSWRVGVDVRDWHEWTRHCESGAESATPDQRALYKELAVSRQHWEAYLSRLEEEKEALQVIKAFSFGPPRTGLQLCNLRTIHVVSGTYQLNKWHVSKTEEHAMLPVTIPLSTWRGDSFSQSLPSILISAIPAAAASAEEWQIDGLTMKELGLLSISSRNYSTNSKLASIIIRLDAGPNYLGVKQAWLASFLGQWRNLESVHLDLGIRTDFPIQSIEDTFEGTNHLNLSHDLAGPQLWPKLRKLSLWHLYSSPKALLSLISRHSSTLRDLRLHAIWLDGGGLELGTQKFWRGILEVIGATTSLEKMALSGVFRNNNCRSDMWDFDDEHLAMVAAHWTINGGKCPLLNTTALESR